MELLVALDSTRVSPALYSPLERCSDVLSAQTGAARLAKTPGLGSAGHHHLKKFHTSSCQNTPMESNVGLASLRVTLADRIFHNAGSAEHQRANLQTRSRQVSARAL
jgi:hypothetical protein